MAYYARTEPITYCWDYVNQMPTITNNPNIFRYVTYDIYEFIILPQDAKFNGK